MTTATQREAELLGDRTVRDFLNIHDFGGAAHVAEPDDHFAALTAWEAQQFARALYGYGLCLVVAVEGGLTIEVRR